MDIVDLSSRYWFASLSSLLTTHKVHRDSYRLFFNSVTFMSISKEKFVWHLVSITVRFKRQTLIPMVFVFICDVKCSIIDPTVKNTYTPSIYNGKLYQNQMTLTAAAFQFLHFLFWSWTPVLTSPSATQNLKKLNIQN